MKLLITSCFALLLIVSCSKSDKEKVFKCKINGIETHSSNAIVSRDSAQININAKLNNGYHISFTVTNWGVKSYSLGSQYDYVEVVGNSEIYFLKKSSAGNGLLSIEDTKGWDFNKRMDGSFHFTILPQSDSPFIVTDGVFKNIPIVDY